MRKGSAPAPETARTCDRCRRVDVDVLPRRVLRAAARFVAWWCDPCVRSYLNVEPICAIETLDVEEVA